MFFDLTSPLTALYKNLSTSRLFSWYNLQCFKHRINYRHNLSIFNELYLNTSGYDVAQKCPQYRTDPTRLYGEIDFLTFVYLLSKTNPRSEDVFVDLGSGLGKACIATSLCFEIKQSIGIEIAYPLHQKAQQILSKAPPKLIDNVQFKNTDILDFNPDCASIIYLNATAFFGSSWDNIYQWLLQLKPHSRLLITSKSLPSEHFNTMFSLPISMSYGTAHVTLAIRNSS